MALSTDSFCSPKSVSFTTDLENTPSGPTLHIYRFHFVGPFPNFTKAYSRMESVEYCQRHRDMSDDRPGPKPVKVELYGVRFSSRLLEGVNRPHGEVSYQ